MRNRYFNYGLLFILSALLIILEAGEMFKRFGDDELSFSGLNYVLVAMLLISFLYIIINKKYLVHTKLKKRFVSLLLVIYGITVVWSLFSPIASRNIYGYLLLPVFMFLLIAILTFLVDNRIINYTFYVIGILLFVYYIYNYRNNISYNIESASNTSYTVLYCLPLMLCIPHKWLRYVAMGVAALAVMLSLKRGGFIAVILAVLVYFYISQVKMGRKKIGIWGWLVVFTVGIVGYWFIARINSALLGNMMYDRMSMIVETGGSSRDIIYMEMIRLIGAEHPGNILFGNGWRATAKDTPFHLTAHNDFLEVLYDFGIFAFVLYIMMYVELLRLTKSLVKNQSEYAPALGASIAIFFINSMVSHIIIYCQYFLIFAIFWGYVSVSNIKKQLKHKKLL